MTRFPLLHSSILWLAICISSHSAHSLIFINAKVGSTIVLPCKWGNMSNPSPHVEWRTFTETVFERIGGELYQGEGYEHRVDVPEDKLLEGDCSLKLNDVRPTDEGVYESFLLVRRTKRSLRSKRVLLQSVELSVDETPESSKERSAVTDNGRMNLPPLKAIVLLPFMAVLLGRSN